MFLDSEATGFRRMTEREDALIHRLLRHDFPGRVQVHDQLRDARVVSLDEDGSLRIATRVPGTAPVVRRISIEASYPDDDGVQVHLLLHVVDGVVDELEVYRDDLARAIRSPYDTDSLQVCVI